MILGVGIDLCDAGRIAKSLEKATFCDYVYAPAEQVLLAGLGGKRRAETAAANFAAKEAFKSGRYRPGRLCPVGAGPAAGGKRGAVL